MVARRKGRISFFLPRCRKLRCRPLPDSFGSGWKSSPLAQGLTRPDGGNMELAGRLHYAGSSLQT